MSDVSESVIMRTVEENERKARETETTLQRMFGPVESRLVSTLPSVTWRAYNTGVPKITAEEAAWPRRLAAATCFFCRRSVLSPDVYREWAQRYGRGWATLQHQNRCPLQPSRRALEWMLSLAEAEEAVGFQRGPTAIADYADPGGLTQGLKARLRNLPGSSVTIPVPANKAAVVVAVDMLLAGRQ